MAKIRDLPIEPLVRGRLRDKKIRTSDDLWREVGPEYPEGVVKLQERTGITRDGLVQALGAATTTESVLALPAGQALAALGLVALLALGGLRIAEEHHGGPFAVPWAAPRPPAALGRWIVSLHLDPAALGPEVAPGTTGLLVLSPRSGSARPVVEAEAVVLRIDPGTVTGQAVATLSLPAERRADVAAVLASSEAFLTRVEPAREGDAGGAGGRAR